GTPLMRFTGEISHNLRHMITRVIRNEPLPERIAFTSALREEGVTYITLATGTTIATNLNKSVCVVELNWWWPNMANQLGVNSPGVAAILTQQASLQQALVETGLPNLVLLPAGDLPIEQRPVVARNAALKKLLDFLTERYDHVLLDIPAILATSDTIALASLAKHCCLVVRQGATPMQNVRLALDDIDHMKIMGLIMNQVRIHTPSFLLKFIPQE
ncbi:MAG: cellulose synthase operon protein YhjQ/BcsQ, partial [Ardenticatenaceae bacterium]